MSVAENPRDGDVGLGDPRPDGTVGVVIVNWKTWRLCVDAVASVRRSEGVRRHVYLVDNASPDGSADHLRDLGDDVTFIRSPVNSGWSGGNNLGIKAALADRCDQIFLLNSDALLLPDTLRKLVGFAERAGGRTVVGPVHQNEAGDHFDFVGATVDGRTGMPRPKEADDAALRAAPADYDTPYIRGAGILLSREQIDQVGFFDDDFYLNYDETDWCFRARRAGYAVRMLRDARIVHYGSGSIGGPASPLNVYFLTRNGLLFSEKYGTARQRTAHIKDTLKYGAGLTHAKGKFARLRTMLFSADPLLIAYRAAVKDYCRRRFGDCPILIRRLNRSEKS